MKLVYCPSCDEVFLRSRLERSVCPNCKGKTRNISLGPSWQYLTAALLLVAGAAIILVLDTQDLGIRLLIFVLLAVIAFSLSSWGVEDQKRKALRLAREEWGEK